jgi:hypothetical protein
MFVLGVIFVFVSFIFNLNANSNLDPNFIKPYSCDPIDVVIPCVEKDLDTLNLCIRGIRENCAGIRKIIVVSEKRLTYEAEWFNEDKYPFSKEDISLYLMHKDEELAEYIRAERKSQLGWYFQQLLKFYAPFVIPGISSNVLIVDADTIFLNPVRFIDEDFLGLYNPGTECHLPYFEHASRLIPHFKKLFPHYSGVSHHMLFQKPILEDLFHMVKKHRKREFWEAFCLCVDPNHVINMISGASEYEIYFNFAFALYPQLKIRPLKWTNSRNLNNIAKYNAEGYHYVSFHRYMRR